MTSLYIELARSIALKAHSGQFDLASNPYWFHVKAVAADIESMGVGGNAIVVAYLHDIIEDCGVTLDYLEQLFGCDVAAAVDAISRRENERYKAYIQRVAQNELALTVKIADLQHNLSAARALPPTQVSREREKKYKKALRFLTSRRG